MFKKFRKLETAIALLVVALVPSSFFSAPVTLHLKLATIAPKGTSLHQTLLSMGQQWRQASGGAIEVNVYPDGVMGGEAEAAVQHLDLKGASAPCGPHS